MSDEELDSALAELAMLVNETVSVVKLVLEDIDLRREWALIDGVYTTTLWALWQSGSGSDVFDWEVSAEGVPGIPVARLHVFLPNMMK